MLIVTLVLAGFVVFVLLGIVAVKYFTPPLAVAPEPKAWVGPIGLLWLQTKWGDPTTTLCRMVARIEGFLGKPITPVTVVFVDGPIKLSAGGLACGKYHTADEWDHPWIELSTGFGSWWPASLEDTAIEHELFHHATGLADTVAFVELFVRYLQTKIES